jgi:hypothetical protein
MICHSIDLSQGALTRSPIWRNTPFIVSCCADEIRRGGSCHLEGFRARHSMVTLLDESAEKTPFGSEPPRRALAKTAS